MSAERRLHKELMSFFQSPPPGASINFEEASQNIFIWNVTIIGTEGTLYAGETFKLNFKFSAKYPFDSPQVTFVPPYVPIHPHIYSNGHICLSILTDDWSPALCVETICLSIISMLSSCKEKHKPPDDAIHVRFGHNNPKRNKWVFHDDTV